MSPERYEHDDDAIEVATTKVARGELVPSHVGVSGTLQSAIAAKTPYFWSSLPQGSHSEKIAVMRLLSSRDNDIDKIIEPKTFLVKDAIVSRISFNNESGEVVFLPKLVLISPSGESISLISEVWISEFIGLFAQLGLPPWTEDVYVSATLRKGRGANSYYTLKVV